MAEAPTRTELILIGAAGVAAAALGGLSWWVVTSGTHLPVVDLRGHAWALEHRGPVDTAVARVITWGGATVITLPALVLIGAATSRARGALLRLRAGALLAGVAGAGVFVGLQLNALIDRARPLVDDWAGAAGGPSFPSGHTTAGALFAGCCAWALTRRYPSRSARGGVWVAGALYAVLVGATRIWLGVHWPTDVAAGLLFALTWLGGAEAIHRTVLRRRRSRAADPTATPEPVGAVIPWTTPDTDSASTRAG